MDPPRVLIARLEAVIDADALASGATQYRRETALAILEHRAFETAKVWALLARLLLARAKQSSELQQIRAWLGYPP